MARLELPLFLALLPTLCGTACSSSDGPPAASGPGSELAVGQKVPFPTKEWTVVTPSEMKMDPALLDKACDYALNFDGDSDGKPDMHTQGVVIVRGGAIVKECYAEGKGPDDFATSWSAAKSFTSTLVGMLIDSGRISDVDVPMATYFPEWAADERKNIRLEDVLWMQSGLKFREEYTDLSSEVIQLFNSPDANVYARSLPFDRPPGTDWYYSSGDTQLLGALIGEVGGISVGDYAREALFDPLGMSAAQWWKDGSGTTNTYCCIDAPTREFAKFGLLALRQGNWDGKRIVSKEWIHKATTTLATQNPGYAYQWWTQGSLKDDLPEYPDLFWADGLDQQKIFVIPSLDLVVAKNTLYTKPDGPAEAAAGAGVLSKIAPRGIWGTDPATGAPLRGTVAPVVWEDAAFLAPIINSIEGSKKIDFTPTQLGSVPGDPAACREAASTGYGTFCEDLHGCVCNKCSAKFLECNANPGCKQLMQCAFERKCRGIGCAAPAPDGCAEVVQQVGGGTGTGGIEVQMGLSLSDCVVAAPECALSCP